MNKGGEVTHKAQIVEIQFTFIWGTQKFTGCLIQSGLIYECQKLGSLYDEYTELKQKYLSGYGRNASCTNNVIIFLKISKLLQL